MRQYLDFLQHILANGKRKDDRTHTGTISVFGYQMRFNLQEGFPLLTTKRVYLKGIIHELLWFIKGDTNIRYLVQNDCNIWNEWPYESYKKSSAYQGESLEEFVSKIRDDEAFALAWGDLGPVYGHQWRHFEGPDKTVDQLREVIRLIKTDSDSRRMIV
ncbi:MAG: thymidylate synthase, partial [Acholeplasmataceae bacterium]|nr:thymidylate synthase [Acholeplasmataceae bacterium]